MLPARALAGRWTKSDAYGLDNAAVEVSMADQIYLLMLRWVQSNFAGLEANILRSQGAGDVMKSAVYSEVDIDLFSGYLFNEIIRKYYSFYQPPLPHQNRVKTLHSPLEAIYVAEERLSSVDDWLKIQTKYGNPF